jgi:hypothetical protein
MERMTERNIVRDGKYAILTLKCSIQEAISKLAELEDKMENGTLIELPCKVGDTIFRIEKDCSKCSFYNEGSWDYNYWCTFDNEDTKNMFEVDGDKDCVYTIKEFKFQPNLNLSENDFLTKAEAKKKLKELKGE